MSHTPTPWRVVPYAQAIHEGYSGPVIKTDEADPWIIAEVSRGIEGEPSEENAAFIVRACNAHEGLVEALHHAEQIAKEFYAMKPNIRKHFHEMNHVECALKVVRAALRKAQEEVLRNDLEVRG